MNALLQHYGLTRAKLAVIAGLVALLFGVWGNALLGGKPKSARRAASEEPAARAQQATRRRGTPPRTTSEDRTPTQLKPSEPVSMPAADTSAVAGRDPFAPPAWARDGSPTDAPTVVSLSDREAVIEQLRAEGVSMVVLSRGKKAANIGGRHVRPGDTLAGYRVLDITPAGVVLSGEPIESNEL